MSVDKKVYSNTAKCPSCSKKMYYSRKGRVYFEWVGLVNKDKYGRRLAYVFVDNGQDKKLHLNLYLVATGTAKSWKYNDVINFRSGIHYENILGMEQIAQKYEMGLWGECY